MIEDRPSQTAAWVATMRALADAGLTNVRDFRDPTARPLLPRRWSLILSATQLWASRMSAPKRQQLAARLDIVALRTAAIDDELRRALEAGCTQLVTLGAGLDGRAHRLPELSAVEVFEVDHPASQRYKRARAEKLPRLSRSLTYVAVDFERDSLAERLSASGHRSNAPTVWIWEGVTMYLTDPALRSTLEVVGAQSAPKSRLLVHYSEPRPDTPESRAIQRFTRFVSEPQMGQRSREVMRAEIERAGLRVDRDTSAVEWSERFASFPAHSPLAAVTRLAVAERV